MLRRYLLRAAIMMLAASLAAGKTGAGISFGPVKAVKGRVEKLKEKVDAAIGEVFDVTIQDPAGDYEDPQGGGPPQGFYVFPSIDLVEVRFGTDEKYFYIRWTVAEKMPSEGITLLDGSKLESISFDTGIDIDRDPNTGCTSDEGVEVLLCCGLRYGSGDPDAYYFADATGIEEPEEHRYATYGKGEVVSGGAGHDQITVRYLLEGIGLEHGMTVDTGRPKSEAKSSSWHHYSFDPTARLTFTVR